MIYLLSGCQIILAAIFLAAATGKIVNPQQLVTALKASQVRKEFVYLLTIAIIVIELELGFNLIVSTSRSLPLTFLCALLLLIIFSGWLFFVYRRKLHISCGCFGNSNTQINRGHVFRNLIFIVLSLLGLFLSFFVSSPLPSSSFDILVVNVILTGCLVAVVSRRLVDIHKENKKQILSLT